jgi:hypothetical protein
VSLDHLRLLCVADPTWDTVLDRGLCDFYHRRTYHALTEAEVGVEAHLAVFGNDERYIAWPYLRRPIAGSTSYDATSVYGYTGPISVGLEQTNPTAAAAFANEAWSALRAAWADQQIVSLFTRFHPLLDNSRLADGFEGAAVGPSPALLTLGRTVSMDLRITSEERFAAYDKETRYEIRRARRMGLEVHVDTTFAHLDDLADLYTQTMLRNDAEERYFFSRHYLPQLIKALEARAHLTVATFEGEIVGALLFVVDGPFAQAHITGVAERHLKLSPLKALLDTSADTAKALGAHWFHLGGGRQGIEDMLFKFKRRIARVEHKFVVGRWVLDEPRYCELAGINLAAAATQQPRFFPAYRAPKVMLSP